MLKHKTVQAFWYSKFFCCLAAWLVVVGVVSPLSAEAADEAQRKAVSSVDAEEFAEEEQQDSFYGFANNYPKDEKITTGRVAASIASAILPGAGQALNGQYLEGAAHFTFFGTTLLLEQSYSIDNNARLKAESQGPNDVYLSDDTVRKSMHSLFHQNTRFYSAFDAYRVASIKLGKQGGKVPISDESLGELVLAPFTPRHLARPLVFTPLFLLGAYYYGRSSAHKEDDSLTRFVLEDGLHKDEIALHGSAQYGAVSLGEEAFYRGILNTELIRTTGVYPGIFFSGLLFGVSHTGDGISASMFAASIYGFYLGYTHHHYGYQLGQNVALHFWWNAIVYAGVVNRSKTLTVPLAYFTF